MALSDDYSNVLVFVVRMIFSGSPTILSRRWTVLPQQHGFGENQKYLGL
jgi:hypothetical protein